MIGSLLSQFAVTTCGSNVGKLCVDSLPQPTASNDNISAALTVVFAIMGAIALLVIVLAGLRYVLSQGDPQKIAQAKNTIIYALIGLVVVIAAQAIVLLAVKAVG